MKQNDTYLKIGLFLSVVSMPYAIHANSDMTLKVEQRLEQLEQRMKDNALELKKAQDKQEKTQHELELTKQALLASSSTEKTPASLPSKRKKPFRFTSVPKHSSQQKFMIWSPSKESMIRFSGLIQLDQDIFMHTHGVSINNGTSSMLVTNGNTVDRFWLRRTRPIVSGMILKYSDFLIEPDFGQGQVRLFDAWLDIHYLEGLEFSAGKQKSIISGWDVYKSPASLFAMEAGYPSMMAPNREYGFILHGGFSAPGVGASHQEGYRYLTSDWFSYQIGVFSGTPDNANPGLNPVSATAFSTETSSTQNKAIELRLFTNPFQKSGIYLLKGLGLGISSGFDRPNNEQSLPAMVSVGQNPIFTYMQNSIAANYSRTRIHPQGYWFIGPFGAIVDWAYTSQLLSSNLISSTSLSPNLLYVRQHNRAGQVQLIYNLTGEQSDFNTQLTPNKPFDPLGSGTWGAFQLLGRYTWLNMDKSVFDAFTTSNGQTTYTFADPRTSVSQASTWSIGVNWFFNQNLRMTTEYDQTSFVGGCSTGAMSAHVNPGCLTSGSAGTASSSLVTNRQDEQVIMQRIQLTI